MPRILPSLHLCRLFCCVIILELSFATARFQFVLDKDRSGTWSFPKSPVVTHYDFGVQHIVLTGVLHVEGKPIVVTLLTYLKAMIQPFNNTLVRWHLVYITLGTTLSNVVVLTNFHIASRYGTGE